MIPMNDALAIIANTLSPLRPQSVPTSTSLYTILANDIYSTAPHPPFRASVKDGYAITSPPPTDASPLIVRSEAVAGSSSPSTPLSPGDAAYVTTGAPVPSGTHAVVMVERCRRQQDRLFIDSWPAVGQDIREIGSDLPAGEIVLRKGTYIGAAEIGLLASCGISSVLVSPRPVVGVLSTGDEIVNLSDVEELKKHSSNGQLPFGKIVDSNRPMLLAAIRESLPFCDTVDLGIVCDDDNSVNKALRDASERCNVVITSGGVSMGRRDAVKPTLAKIGTVHFGRVIMKPGKPLTYATLTGRSDRCFVALPGNPVSCFVCFHLAVSVAARRLAGWSARSSLGVKVEARLSQDIKLDAERPEYHRAILQWVDGQGYVATSTGKQASSRLLSARSANALLELPAKNATLPEGATVKAFLLMPAHGQYRISSPVGG